jgi:RecA-family ATPase
MESSKLKWALDTASRGFRVFPIEPNTKRPKRYLPWKDAATTDPAAIIAWWGENPDYNIGVATGGKTFVVDADTKDGKPGLDSLAILDMLGLPESFRVATPSGGVHVYLKSDIPHRNSVDSIADYPGIDVRAEDEYGKLGYVVGPGSTIDGKSYTPVSDTAIPISDSPEWLDDILAKSAKQHAPRSDAPPAVELDLPANVERAMQWLTEQAPTATLGAGSNNTTYSIAAELRAKGISEATALDLMLTHWNDTKSNPPWPPEKLEKMVSHGYRYGQGAAGGKTAAGEFGAVDIEIGEPPKGARAEHTHDASDDILPTVSAASFADQETPVRKWRVPDVIPDENVTIINGDGATGKSLLAMQLAIASAAETHWLGEKVEPGPVLYFSAEDDEAETHIRIKEICKAENIDIGRLEGLRIAVMAGENCVLAVEGGRSATVLARTRLFRTLENTIAAMRPGFVFLDNLADIYGANENVRELARQFIGMLRALAIKYHCAVILLAHPSLSGMASGSGSSGNTAWNNSPRARLYLQRDKDDKGVEADPNLRVLEIKKANYTAMGRKIEIRWESGRFKSTAPDFADLEDADAPTETPMQKAERVFLKLVEKFNGMSRNVAVTRGSNYAPKLFADHNASERVPQRMLEMAMENLLETGKIVIEKSGPPSKPRQNLVLARGNSTPLPPPSTPLPPQEPTEGVEGKSTGKSNV